MGIKSITSTNSPTSYSHSGGTMLIQVLKTIPSHHIPLTPPTASFCWHCRRLSLHLQILQMPPCPSPLSFQLRTCLSTQTWSTQPLLALNPLCSSLATQSINILKTFLMNRRYNYSLHSLGVKRHLKYLLQPLHHCITTCLHYLFLYVTYPPLSCFLTAIFTFSLISSY